MLDIKNAFHAIFNSRRLIRTLVFVVIPAVIFYIASLQILQNSGLDSVQILRDPAQQSGESSFIGFLSNIGTWLWISASAICFFTILTRRKEFQAEEIQLLALVGTLSILLGVDDFFLIHDRYINQRICYGTYGLIALAILFRHYKQILAKDPFAFLLAGGLLAASIGTDLIQGRLLTFFDYSFTQLFEEGFKFTGAATWLYFSGRIASSSEG